MPLVARGTVRAKDLQPGMYVESVPGWAEVMHVETWGSFVHVQLRFPSDETGTVVFRYNAALNVAAEEFD